jgi:glycosyltransferase involved in cell wall biosynthesis
MKVAILTLTRDRLDFTKHCFKTLQNKAGYLYDHYVHDNGSTDGTAMWLLGQLLTSVYISSENLGIACGMNELRETIRGKGYDLVIKFDNDCEVVSDNILKEVVEMYEKCPELQSWALTPRTEGLRNQPRRGLDTYNFNGNTVKPAGIIGGIFKIMPAKMFFSYRNNEELPKASGNDSYFSTLGYRMGYIENLTVNHYLTTDGQAKRYPEYFKRKHEEEK